MGCDIYIHPYAQDHNSGYILVDLDRAGPTVVGSMSLDPLDDADLHTHVKQYVRIDDAETDRLIAVYKKARPSAGNTDLYLAIASDNWIRTSTIAEADRKAAQRAPGYMYYFTSLVSKTAVTLSYSAY